MITHACKRKVWKQATERERGGGGGGEESTHTLLSPDGMAWPLASSSSFSPLLVTFSRSLSRIFHTNSLCSWWKESTHPRTHKVNLQHYLWVTESERGGGGRRRGRGGCRTVSFVTFSFFSSSSSSGDLAFFAGGPSVVSSPLRFLLKERGAPVSAYMLQSTLADKI